MSASCPPSTRSTSAMTVASPHSSRWSPSTHRSPGCVTACSGSAGASSSSVRPSLPPASSRSSSPSPKPTSPRSKPSSERSASSSRSSSSSQPAFSASWLSASTIRPLLRLAHVGELDHRHLLQPQLPGRQHPAVPGDDAALPVDQHRIRPAELPDARRDLRHLGIASGCAGCGHRGSARPAAARRSRDRPSSGPHKVAMNRRASTGQEFSGSAAERPDTPLRNFAGINSATARPVPAGRSVNK